MTNQTEQGAERAAFEAWAGGAGGLYMPLDRLPATGFHRADETVTAWAAWQARAKSTPEGCGPAAIWDRPGPQLAAVEHGREPTLREVLHAYYVGPGISKAKAARLTERYIAAATPGDSHA